MEQDFANIIGAVFTEDEAAEIEAEAVRDAFVKGSRVTIKFVNKLHTGTVVDLGITREGRNAAVVFMDNRKNLIALETSNLRHLQEN